VFAVFAVVAVVLAACSEGSGKPAADRARTATTAPTVSTSTTMPATTTTTTVSSAPTTLSAPSTTNPGSPSLSPQAGGSGSGSPDYAAQLKWAQCMQAHGVDVPDPVAPGSGPATQSKVKGATRYVLVGSSGPNTQGSGGVNPNSPQYIAANNACQSLLPAGSGPSLSGPGAP
jgi:hypothetical protein